MTTYVEVEFKIDKKYVDDLERYCLDHNISIDFQMNKLLSEFSDKHFADSLTTTAKLAVKLQEKKLK